MNPHSQRPTRILVVETLYLGDLIHTLPLLQALRAAYPEARLDVLVRAPHVGLMAQVAGVDEVLAMDPRQHRGLGGIRALARQLRAREYDWVINPGASDRATLLTWLSGGRRRIGRLNRKQSRWLWPRLHDEVVDQPWGSEPMYWQKLTAFQSLLQLSDRIDFGLDFSTVALPDVSLPPRYVHLSPFASESIRCLPPATVVELVAGLRQALPEHGLVLSCGPSASETGRLRMLEPALRGLGAVCLPGRLSLPQLGALIQRAAVHLGPDSGPLHCAVAVGTPAVGCFLFKHASAEWMPVGASHRSFGTMTRLDGGLYGLPVADIVAAVTTAANRSRA